MLEYLKDIDQAVTLYLNGSSSLFLDGIAMTATATSTWLPVAVVLLYVILRNNNWTNTLLILAGIALCVLVADQVASGICKPLFSRYRPSNDPEIMYAVDIVGNYRGGKYGFFSSHAANTFAVASFVSLLIRSTKLTTFLFSWALLNCWTRVYLGVHYVGDLTVGVIWGTLVGVAMYYAIAFFRERNSRSNRYNTRSFRGISYAKSDIALLILCISLTYLFIPFGALWAAPQ